ncbi:acyl-CoA carboxylase epsilon subunit [Candidatus Chloroploca asiatica]|uniref:Uncharacterized protein n=1 Tax=Candidatus Chloroploca asiatica TaxID=1506545 RepID=A0A2H3KNQ5_9CHLR|nr:acyl-CoA carboxylase epsilon subunit [Candidatus Chloroploca asiatica]PDV99030.1 hypothetical protein A9Q02_13800 [Candidatus Chloroploca asiatica]
MHTIVTGGTIDEEEVAAALAVVAAVLESEAAALTQPGEPTMPGWVVGARLITQGLRPTRVPTVPRWHTIERLRRAERASTGIVGQ